jgi:hypothetical protein
MAETDEEEVTTEGDASETMTESGEETEPGDAGLLGTVLKSTPYLTSPVFFLRSNKFIIENITIELQPPFKL